MRYRSTRGGAEGKGFVEVLEEGLAPDGGLYVPESIPAVPEMPSEYAPAVAAVAQGFVEPDLMAADLTALATEAYAGFRHPEVAPLRTIDPGLHLLELYWGPTLSFKDYALQFVGSMFGQSLSRGGGRLLILGATSGDTGSAAIEACRGRPGVEVVVLYPHEAISEVQRRQMTTVADPNVHVVAVEGTFDDCQRLVKRAFTQLGDRHRMTAFNSINWARIVAQTAYYAYISSRFDHPVRFVVPTGNFGNVLSAHVARRMGAPIARLTVANNVNHGLTDLITTGILEVSAVESTLAPAMDVTIPSNLERYLFEILDEDPRAISEIQAGLEATGRIALSDAARERMSSDFEAAWRPDTDIIETIRRAHSETGVVLDPHTAVAWSVAAEKSTDTPTVVVATAHPAKFPEVVEAATGLRPGLPADLAEQLAGPERMTRLGSDSSEVGALIDSVMA